METPWALVFEGLERPRKIHRTGVGTAPNAAHSLKRVRPPLLLRLLSACNVQKARSQAESPLCPSMQGYSKSNRAVVLKPAFSKEPKLFQLCHRVFPGISYRVQRDLPYAKIRRARGKPSKSGLGAPTYLHESEGHLPAERL